ncbi:MAG TPA: stage II sporulation protein M [Steroidobacteraceae bacterium]
MRQYRRAFLILCATFYGLLALAMLMTMFVPELKPLAKSFYDINNLRHLALIQNTFNAYTHGHLLTAAALTFVVNLGVAVLLTTVPSLIIPFIGILAVFYRGLLWGAMFAPFGVERLLLVPHFPTVLLEGLGYVVAAFATYVHGVMIMRPAQYGFASRGEAYRKGLKVVAQVYLIVVPILVFAALYEGFEVIHLVPSFVHPSSGK